MVYGRWYQGSSASSGILCPYFLLHPPAFQQIPAVVSTATFAVAAITNFGPLADALNPSVAKFLVMALSGALGIKMAKPDQDVVVFVGDGSYL